MVFAFFGYNESYAGAGGLEKFKSDLEDFIKHTLRRSTTAHALRGWSSSRRSPTKTCTTATCPTACRTTPGWNFTPAMAEVAKANNVPFVDLLQPTLAGLCEGRQAADDQRHPSHRAGRRGAGRDDRPGLFAASRRRSAIRRRWKNSARRCSIRDFCWFKRYRTTDGYSIYGGRADLAFVDRQTNRVVAAREMEVLDVMTANRDKRIWAVANGGDLQGGRQQHAAVPHRQDEQAGQRPQRRAHLPLPARKRSTR